jgi:hypothetical protein
VLLRSVFLLLIFGAEMGDTAATLQQEYDWAVHDFGVDSKQAKQAKQAELAAQQFFTGNPPLEPVSPKPVPALTAAAPTPKEPT